MYYTKPIPPLQSDFWDEVIKDGCWDWYGETNKAGYGLYDGAKAHRVSFQHRHGPPPHGWHVHHQCERRTCVNWDHLTAEHPKRHRVLHSRYPERVWLFDFDLGL